MPFAAQEVDRGTAVDRARQAQEVGVGQVAAHRMRSSRRTVPTCVAIAPESRPQQQGYPQPAMRPSWVRRMQVSALFAVPSAVMLCVLCGLARGMLTGLRNIL